MTRAAYDLQVRAAAHSARCGHPGYVPDDYLEHLDGLGIETTISAAELCAIGTWERVGYGYRVEHGKAARWLMVVQLTLTGRGTARANILLLDLGMEDSNHFHPFPFRILAG